MARRPTLGSGKRFSNLTKKLGGKGATNPGGLAAYIGRKKFGKTKFQSLAAHGKKRKPVDTANDNDADDMRKAKTYRTKRRATGFSGGQPRSTGKPTVSKVDNKIRFGPLKTNNVAVNPMMRLKKAMRKIARK